MSPEWLWSIVQPMCRLVRQGDGMSVTLFCLTDNCDFQFVQIPSASVLNECPKCHGRAFSSEKGALGQHPYHTDDVACLICTLSEEIARLQAQPAKAEAVARAAEKIWGRIPVTGPGTLGPDVAVPLLAYEALRMALAAYRERA